MQQVHKNKDIQVVTEAVKQNRSKVLGQAPVPDAFHARAKELARKQGMTMQEASVYAWCHAWPELKQHLR